MEKKNKQILDDVQKYLKNESEQLKKKKKIKENKEDDSQKIEKTSFEHIVRSEVKAWIKKMLKSLVALLLKML